MLLKKIIIIKKKSDLEKNKRIVSKKWKEKFHKVKVSCATILYALWCVLLKFSYFVESYPFFV